MSNENDPFERELALYRKSGVIAYVLWVGLFGCGTHRMYLNRVRSGLCQLGLLVLSVGMLVVAAALYFEGNRLPEEDTEAGILLLGLLGVGSAGLWLLWTLTDALFIPRWLREDTEHARTKLAARYRP